MSKKFSRSQKQALHRLRYRHLQALHKKDAAQNKKVALIIGLFALCLALVLTPIGVGLAGAQITMRAYEVFEARTPPVSEFSSYNMPQTTYIYDRTGTVLLRRLYTEDRNYVDLDNIPQQIIDATVATEDRTFYENEGVDYRAIVRAALANLEAGAVTQGGSTITQQLVKLIVLGEEDSYDRKVREAIFSLNLTETYSKDQIMEIYLNYIFYGNGAYGIESAARRYFAKSLDELTLAETAVLVGIPQSPTDNNPLINSHRARQRQLIVLTSMLEEKYITLAQFNQARNEQLVYIDWKEPTDPYPWFTERVIDQLIDRYGSYETIASSGFIVRTTLDVDLQKLAQAAIDKRLDAALPENNVHNAAMVSQVPATGEVLVYIGSADLNDDSIKVQGEFDSAGIGLRSPGSSWKPLVYLAAFEKGWSPATLVYDTPTEFVPDYAPQNAFRNFLGITTPRQALRESRNVPAIKALYYAGFNEVVDLAIRLGMPNTFGIPEQLGPSFALGTHSVKLSDVVGAYSTINNYGLRVPQQFLLEIEDYKGQLIYRLEPENLDRERAVDAGLAYSILDILKDNADPEKNWLTGADAFIDRPAFAKTGTENDTRDLYAMAGIPQLTSGVWMGNADNTPMNNYFSNTGPLQIWKDFILEAVKLREWKETDWIAPDNVVRATVCSNQDIRGGYGYNGPDDADCPNGWGSTETFVAGINEPSIENKPIQSIRLHEGRRMLPSCDAGSVVKAWFASDVKPEFNDDLTKWVSGLSRGENYEYYDFSQLPLRVMEIPEEPSSCPIRQYVVPPLNPVNEDSDSTDN